MRSCANEHGIELQLHVGEDGVANAGLVKRRKKPGSHRKRRPRRPLPGMMLHIDGSEHRWFGDERYYELIVILDDATSEIYYAQLVEAESTRSVMAALREVVETRGLFCSLYSDRAGHFFVTPKRGERVDTSRPTQVGRALQELGVKMIAGLFTASARTIGAQLRDLAGPPAAGAEMRGITDHGASQRVPAERIHCRVQQPVYGKAAAEGQRVCAARRKDLDWIFSVQHERTVNNDNTLVWKTASFSSIRHAGGIPWQAKRSWCMNIWTAAYRSAMDRT